MQKLLNKHLQIKIFWMLSQIFNERTLQYIQSFRLRTDLYQFSMTQIYAGKKVSWCVILEMLLL